MHIIIIILLSPIELVGLTTGQAADAARAVGWKRYLLLFYLTPVSPYPIKERGRFREKGLYLS